MTLSWAELLKSFLICTGIKISKHKNKYRFSNKNKDDAFTELTHQRIQKLDILDNAMTFRYHMDAPNKQF